MSRTATCLLLLALSSCATPDTQCQFVRVADIPFTIDDGQLIVTALLDGRPARLAFDTGSPTSVLTHAAVARLHLATREAYTGDLQGIGGDRPAGMVVAKQVQINGLHGSDFPFLTSDVYGLAENRPDGLLSSDLMSKYDIDLDFPDSKIILYYSLNSCQNQPAVALDPPLYPVNLISPTPDRGSAPQPGPPPGEPTVLATVNGHVMQAVIDTGADQTAIFRDAAANAGLTGPNPFDGATAATTSGTGPHDVRSTVQRFAQIGIGDVVIQNLPVVVLDQHRLDDIGLLLGVDFLARVHVWISHSSNTLVLQVPPLPSPPAPK